MTSEFKDESLKSKDKTFLEQYLAGKAPLHADRLNLPSDEELDAAEAEFDEILASRKRPTRHIPLWPWAIAAVAASILFLLVFNINKETIEEKPVVAEVIEPEVIKQSKPQPVPSPIVEEKKEEVLAEVQPTKKSVKKRRKVVREKSSPVEPSAIETTNPPVTAEPALAYRSVESAPSPDDFSSIQDIRSRGERLQRMVDAMINE